MWSFVTGRYLFESSRRDRSICVGLRRGFVALGEVRPLPEVQMALDVKKAEILKLDENVKEAMIDGAKFVSRATIDLDHD